MIHLCLGVLILAALAAGEDKAIRIACGKNRVNVTWRLSRQLAPHGSRFFLGNCIRSHAAKLPGGEVELQFDVSFSECKFTKLMKGKHVVFQNKLTYRPQSKSKPPAYEYPVRCVYDRPEAWVPPFLNPGFSASAGRGGLIFHMALLNEQMSGVAKTNVVPLGSFMAVWAAVEQQGHQPLRLFMEECVVADTAVLQPRRQVYPVVGNKGCLTDSVRTNSVFLPRYHSSAIVLYMQTLMLGVGEVYIHCKLVAWDPEVLNESKKACHYSKQNSMWEMLDDPAQSDLCSCCDNTCGTRPRRQAEQDSGRFSQHSVLGPLVIV